MLKVKKIKVVNVKFFEILVALNYFNYIYIQIKLLSRNNSSSKKFYFPKYFKTFFKILNYPSLS